MSDVAGSMTLLAGVLIETRRYDEARALAADAKSCLSKAARTESLANRQRRER